MREGEQHDIWTVVGGFCTVGEKDNQCSLPAHGLYLGGGNDYHLTLWGGQVVWTSTLVISGGNVTVQQTALLSKARLWEVSPPAMDGKHTEAALYDLETKLIQHG